LNSEAYVSPPWGLSEKLFSAVYRADEPCYASLITPFNINLPTCAEVPILPQGVETHTFHRVFEEDSALFWIFAGILTVLCALALGLPFWRPRSVPPSRSEHDVEAFQAQLREVDTDLARGVMTPDEAESARIELSRRLLAAAEAAEVDAGSKPTPKSMGAVIGIVTALGVPAIGLGIYSDIGTPTLEDKPLAERDFALERGETRPSQEQAEAQYAEQDRETPAPTKARADMLTLTERVKERLAKKPDDPRGWDVLARSLKSLEIYDESWRAFQKVTELDPEAADATLYADMTEAMFMAAGGYISPQAEEAVNKALELDSGLHQALFFKSIALAQRGEMRPAIEGWVQMLRTAPPNAPWIEQVQDNIREAAAEIGVEPPADLVPKGPTAAQRAAAAEMAPEDRMAMIAGMVDGLAERLEDDPSDLQGWMMLIRSYRILGRDEDAKAAQTRGLEAFQRNPEAKAQLEGAL
jgi:cytochrome c-type biogenesis protein CcmH